MTLKTSEILSRRIRRHAAAVTLLVGACVGILFGMPPRSSFLDFPIQVISTQRVLRGERPHADFEALYGPVGHYTSALGEYPLRSLPPATAANCFYLLCSLGFLAIAVYVAGRQIPGSRPRFYLGVLGLLVFSTAVLSTYSFYSLPAQMLLYVALLLLPSAFGETASSRRSPALAQAAVGLLIGLAIFTRLNFGVYLPTAIAVAGMLAFFFGNRRAARGALGCLLAAVVMCVVLLGIFTALGIAGPEIADMRLYIPRWAASRGLPLWNNPNIILFWLVLLAASGSLLKIGAKLLRRQADSTVVAHVLLYLFISYSLFRFDQEHAYPAALLSLLLVSDFAFPDVRVGPVAPRQSWMGIADWHWLTVMLMISWLTLGPFGQFNLQRARTYWGSLRQHVPLTRQGVWVYPLEASLLDYLDSVRRPGEEFYVASEQGSCQSTHDNCANLSLYLAEKTLPAEKLWYFDTASTAYPEVQQAVVDELRRRKTPWIILETLPRRNGAPIDRSEARVLTDFVLTNYEALRTFASYDLNVSYTVYKRKDGGDAAGIGRASDTPERSESGTVQRHANLGFWMRPSTQT